MYCSSCGEPVTEGKAFCKYCGTPVRVPLDAGEAATVVQAPSDTGEAATLVKSPDWSEHPTAVKPPDWSEAATVVLPDAAEAATMVQPPDAGEAETLIAPPSDEAGAVLPHIADVHKVVPPPVTSPGAGTSPPQFPPAPQMLDMGATAVRARPAYPEYGQVQPSPEPRRKGRGGLITGVIIAILIVAAAAAAATILLVRDNGSSASGTSTAQVATTAQATTTVPQSTTSLTASTTATTALPTTTSAVTSTTVVSAEHYLAAMNAVVGLLAKDDARIPELATQINASAPNVPKAVYDELQTMLGQLDAAVTELSSLQVPVSFQVSHTWLDEASTWMGTRINATILGIEAMYNTGKVSSATKHFKEGQVARDRFRTAFQKFQDARPNA